MEAKVKELELEVARLKRINSQLELKYKEAYQRLQQRNSHLSLIKKVVSGCQRCHRLHVSTSRGHTQVTSNNKSSTRDVTSKKRRVKTELIEKYPEIGTPPHTVDTNVRGGQGGAFTEYLQLFTDNVWGMSPRSAETENTNYKQGQQKATEANGNPKARDQNLVGTGPCQPCVEALKTKSYHTEGHNLGVDKSALIEKGPVVLDQVVQSERQPSTCDKVEDQELNLNLPEPGRDEVRPVHEQCKVASKGEKLVKDGLPVDLPGSSRNFIPCNSHNVPGNAGPGREKCMDERLLSNLPGLGENISVGVPTLEQETLDSEETVGYSDSNAIKEKFYAQIYERNKTSDSNVNVQGDKSLIEDKSSDDAVNDTDSGRYISPEAAAPCTGKEIDSSSVEIRNKDNSSVEMEHIGKPEQNTSPKSKAGVTPKSKNLCKSPGRQGKQIDSVISKNTTSLQNLPLTESRDSKKREKVSRSNISPKNTKENKHQRHKSRGKEKEQTEEVEKTVFDSKTGVWSPCKDQVKKDKCHEDRSQSHGRSSRSKERTKDRTEGRSDKKSKGSDVDKSVKDKSKERKTKERRSKAKDDRNISEKTADLSLGKRSRDHSRKEKLSRSEKVTHVPMPSSTRDISPHKGVVHDMSVPTSNKDAQATAVAGRNERSVPEAGLLEVAQQTIEKLRRRRTSLSQSTENAKEELTSDYNKDNNNVSTEGTLSENMQGSAESEEKTVSYGEMVQSEESGNNPNCGKSTELALSDLVVKEVSKGDLLGDDLDDDPYLDHTLVISEDIPEVPLSKPMRAKRKRWKSGSYHEDPNTSTGTGKGGELSEQMASSGSEEKIVATDDGQGHLEEQTHGGQSSERERDSNKNEIGEVNVQKTPVKDDLRSMLPIAFSPGRSKQAFYERQAYFSKRLFDRDMSVYKRDEKNTKQSDKRKLKERRSNAEKRHNTKQTNQGLIPSCKSLAHFKIPRKVKATEKGNDDLELESEKSVNVKVADVENDPCKTPVSEPVPQSEKEASVKMDRVEDETLKSVNVKAKIPDLKNVPCQGPYILETTRCKPVLPNEKVALTSVSAKIDGVEDETLKSKRAKSVNTEAKISDVKKVPCSKRPYSLATSMSKPVPPSEKEALASVSVKLNEVEDETLKSNITLVTSKPKFADVTKFAGGRPYLYPPLSMGGTIDRAAEIKKIPSLLDLPIRKPPSLMSLPIQMEPLPHIEWYTPRPISSLVLAPEPTKTSLKQDLAMTGPEEKHVSSSMVTPAEPCQPHLLLINHLTEPPLIPLTVTIPKPPPVLSVRDPRRYNSSLVQSQSIDPVPTDPRLKRRVQQPQSTQPVLPPAAQESVENPNATSTALPPALASLLKSGSQVAPSQPALFQQERVQQTLPQERPGQPGLNQPAVLEPAQLPLTIQSAEDILQNLMKIALPPSQPPTQAQHTDAVIPNVLQSLLNSVKLPPVVCASVYSKADEKQICHKDSNMMKGTTEAVGIIDRTDAEPVTSERGSIRKIPSLLDLVLPVKIKRSKVRPKTLTDEEDIVVLNAKLIEETLKTLRETEYIPPCTSLLGRSNDQEIAPLPVIKETTEVVGRTDRTVVVPGTTERSSIKKIPSLLDLELPVKIKQSKAKPGALTDEERRETEYIPPCTSLPGRSNDQEIPPLPLLPPARTCYPVKITKVHHFASDEEQLLAYLSLDKRRTRSLLKERKVNLKVEKKLVGAELPNSQEVLADEDLYGGRDSDAMEVEEEEGREEEQSEGEMSGMLSPNTLERLWNQGVDTHNMEALEMYIRMTALENDVSETLNTYSGKDLYDYQEPYGDDDDEEEDFCTDLDRLSTDSEIEYIEKAFERLKRRRLNDDTTEQTDTVKSNVNQTDSVECSVEVKDSVGSCSNQADSVGISDNQMGDDGIEQGGTGKDGKENVEEIPDDGDHLDEDVSKNPVDEFETPLKSLLKQIIDSPSEQSETKVDIRKHRDKDKPEQKEDLVTKHSNKPSKKNIKENDRKEVDIGPKKEQAEIVEIPNDGDHLDEDVSKNPVDDIFETPLKSLLKQIIDSPCEQSETKVDKRRHLNQDESPLKSLLKQTIDSPSEQSESEVDVSQHVDQDEPEQKKELVTKRTDGPSKECIQENDRKEGDPVELSVEVENAEESDGDLALKLSPSCEEDSSPLRSTLRPPRRSPLRYNTDSNNGDGTDPTEHHEQITEHQERITDQQQQIPERHEHITDQSEMKTGKEIGNNCEMETVGTNNDEHKTNGSQEGKAKSVKHVHFELFGEESNTSDFTFPKPALDNRANIEHRKKLDEIQKRKQLQFELFGEDSLTSTMDKMYAFTSKATREDPCSQNHGNTERPDTKQPHSGNKSNFNINFKSESHILGESSNNSLPVIQVDEGELQEHDFPPKYTEPRTVPDHSDTGATSETNSHSLPEPDNSQDLTEVVPENLDPVSGSSDQSDSSVTDSTGQSEPSETITDSSPNPKAVLAGLKPAVESPKVFRVVGKAGRTGSSDLGESDLDVDVGESEFNLDPASVVVEIEADEEEEDEEEEEEDDTEETEFDTSVDEEDQYNIPVDTRENNVSNQQALSVQRSGTSDDNRSENGLILKKGNQDDDFTNDITYEEKSDEKNTEGTDADASKTEPEVLNPESPEPGLNDPAGSDASPYREPSRSPGEILSDDSEEEPEVPEILCYEEDSLFDAEFSLKPDVEESKKKPKPEAILTPPRGRLRTRIERRERGKNKDDRENRTPPENPEESQQIRSGSKRPRFPSCEGRRKRQRRQSPDFSDSESARRRTPSPPRHSIYRTRLSKVGRSERERESRVSRSPPPPPHCQQVGREVVSSRAVERRYGTRGSNRRTESDRDSPSSDRSGRDGGRSSAREPSARRRNETRKSR